MKRSRKFFRRIEWSDVFIAGVAIVFLGAGATFGIAISDVDDTCRVIMSKDSDKREWDFESGDYEVEVNRMTFDHMSVGQTYCGPWRGDD